MDAEQVTATLAKPIAQQLMASDTPARLAYLGLDGDPRVVPVGFWWTGTDLAVGTVPTSAKVAAIRRSPRVALTVDTTATSTAPPRTLLVRGAATVEVVDGVPDGYVDAGRKVTPPEHFAAWEAGVRALYRQMAVITVRPDHAILHDFETTIPKAVADLVAAHGDPR